MSLKERLEEELKTTLKARNKAAVAALRLTLSDIKYAEKDKRAPLDDGETVQILRTAVKKRKEAIELFRQGGRTDLVEKEIAEVSFLETFLPPSLSAEDLAALVEEGLRDTGAASIRDMGLVMKWIMPRLEGRAEGSEVNRLVKEKLTPPK
jgi:hypothetical protein